MSSVVIRQSSWGPSYWNFLHWLAITFPEHPLESDRIHFQQCLQHLAHIMPCPKCQEHMREYLDGVQWATVLENRKKCIDFIWRFHNDVNRRLAKPMVSKKEFLQFYHGIIVGGEWNPLTEHNELRIYKRVCTILSVLCMVAMGGLAYAYV